MVKLDVLTHWGQVTFLCIGNLATIGLHNGLLPGWRQAIFWTSAAILLIGPLGTNFSEILIEIITFSVKKMFLKVSSAKTAAISVFKINGRPVLATKKWAGPVKFDPGQVKILINYIRRGIFWTFLGD